MLVGKSDRARRDGRDASESVGTSSRRAPPLLKMHFTHTFIQTSESTLLLLTFIYFTIIIRTYTLRVDPRLGFDSLYTWY